MAAISPERLLNNFSILLILFLLPTLYVRRNFLDIDDRLRCTTLLTQGRWSHEFDSLAKGRSWNPTNCYLRSFSADEVKACVKHTKIMFIGDSTMREIFWAVAKKMDHSLALNSSRMAQKHSNLSYIDGDASISFIWDPYLNITEQAASTSISSTGPQDASTINSSPSNTAYVIGFGLWVARHLEAGFVDAFNASLRHLIMPQQAIFLPVIKPLKENLNMERSETLSVSRVQFLNDVLKAFSQEKGSKVIWSAAAMTDTHNLTYQDDGIHLIEQVVSAQSDVLLNYVCNSGPLSQQLQSKNSCCGKHPNPTSFQLILLCLAFMVVSLYLFGRSLKMTKVRIFDTASLFSSSKVVRPLAVLSASLIYCYLADRTTVFEKTSKIVDEKLFLAIVAVGLLVGLLTVTDNGPVSIGKGEAELLSKYHDSFLSRQQTEEWKGWMQIVILLYHYFGMSKVLWIYRFVRLLVASYLFMTGFGHSVYFLKTNDHSLRRGLTVLIRQNLLSSMLPYFMGTTYDFYYFPALASFWFLITWLTIARASPNKINLFDIGLRIVVSVIIVRHVLNSESFLTSFFDLLCKIGLTKVDVQEFRFRILLDWQVTYYGMTVAAIYLKYRENRMLENLSIWSRYSQRTALIFTDTLLVAILLAAYLMICNKSLDKFQYNRWHPLISPWPILAFVIVRNANSWMRRRHSQFFAWMGRFSLETYILQYHIWLAADTKGLLHLGIIDRTGMNSRSTVSSWAYWMEAGIITTIFLWVSSAVAVSTSTFSAWLVEIGEGRNWRLSSRVFHRRQHGYTFPQSVTQANPTAHHSMWMKPIVIFLVLWLSNLLW